MGEALDLYAGRSWGDLHARGSAARIGEGDSGHWGVVRTSVKLVAILHESQEKALWARIRFATLTIACGCLSLLPMEALNRKARGFSSLLSLTMAVWMLAGLAPRAWRGGFLFAPRCPWWVHIASAGLFYAFSALQNLSLKLGLPMAIFLLLKNGVLAANMIAGAVILRKRYSWGQILGVALVSSGIAISSASTMGGPPGPGAGGAGGGLLPVGLMVGALMALALLGLLQDRAFRVYRASPDEALFFQYLLALPLLWLSAGDPKSRLQEITRGETWAVPRPAAGWLGGGVGGGTIGPAVPAGLVLMAANIWMAQVCKSSVTALTERSSSLTGALVLTVQRFISIAVSAVWVNAPPPPPPMLWVGCGVLLSGSLLYLACSQPPPPPEEEEEEEEEGPGGGGVLGGEDEGEEEKKAK